MGVLESFCLTNRRALVTGASRGIGRAIAVAIAQAGADVALLARSEADLQETARQAAATGRRAVPLAVDLRDLASLATAIDHAAQALGGLDVLVNNAGTNTSMNEETVTPAEFDRVMDVNFRAVVFASRAARPHLRAAGGGVIINIGSIAAAKGVHVYGASKAAVAAYTLALSRAWADDHIRCVAIAPGQVDTEMTAHLRAHPERRAALLRHTARHRAAQPEEIAALAVYLASPAADFVSGTTVAIDGGRTVYYD